MTLPPEPTLDSHQSLLETLFSVSWRLSLFLLPLQTRWYSEALLAGWPWTQGQGSFYVSWIPIAVTIGLGVFQPKKVLPVSLQRNVLFFIAALAAATIVANPVSFVASAQWWIQILFLASFFITLLRTNVQLESIVSWFIISLIPHAFFALVQVYLQYVPGWSWIGVATQAPADLGVSVVQTMKMRWLRAYGGFPHPNILGGWMALGMLALGWIAAQPINKYQWGDVSLRCMCWFVLVPFFAVVLFYSFSRSAWIGFFVGAIILIASHLADAMTKPKSSGTKHSSLAPSPFRAIMATCIAIFTFGLFAIIDWDLTASRVGLTTTPRLETQSLDARALSLQNGIRVFQTYPLFGTGPNAELPALACLQQSPHQVCDFYTLASTDAPLESPHNVWILLFSNFGTVGSLIVFGFILYLLRKLLVPWRYNDPPIRSLLFSCIGVLFTISIFDHYPWSLWSGQVLMVFCLFLIMQWIVSKKVA